MDEKILEILYRSFDSEINQDEQKQLKDALENSDELQNLKEDILKMRASLKQKDPKSFGYMFADKVMQRINVIEDKSTDELFFDSIISVFKPLAIAATFLLIFMFSYNIINESGSLFKGYQKSQDITLAEAFDPFTELSTE